MKPKTIIDIIKNQYIKKYYFVIKQRFFSEKLMGAEFYRLFPYASEINGLSASSFLDEFQKVARQNFFFTQGNRKDLFLQLLNKQDPMPGPIIRAEKILKNTHTVFGSEFWYGQNVDWFLDFKSGQKFPSKPFYTSVKTAKYSADIKVPWEISRFSFVWILGKAYWISGRMDYKEKFLELFKSWQGNNPFGYGINWISPMEVALRAMNMVAGYYFFFDQAEQSGQHATDWVELLKSLFQHGCYLEQNLPYERQSGRELIASATALYMLGMFFKPSNFSMNWCQVAGSILEEEISRQTFPDGMHYEMSVACHRFVTEMFLAAYILGERLGMPFSIRYQERLIRMLGVVMHYIKPDSQAPLLGDSDDSRMFWFNPEEDYNNHTGLLSLAATVFEKREFKRMGQTFSEEALWLTGAEGWESYERLKPDSQPLWSKKFEYSGLVIMRSEALHVVANCGAIGKNGRGGMGHNDILSFELWAGGINFLVDCGTLRMSGHKSERNEFRSTKAHNTAMIDGVEQAGFLNDLRIEADYSTPKILEWSSTESEDLLVAEQYAYKSMLTEPVTHKRTFVLDKMRYRLTIIDDFYGQGNHTAELFFHFNAGVQVEKTSYNRIFLKDSETGMRMDMDYERKDEEILIDPGLIAWRYGQTKPNKVLRFRKRFSGEMTFKIMFTLNLPAN